MTSTLDTSHGARPPARRPLAPWSFLIPLFLAAVVGWALAYDFWLTLAACVAVGLGGALLVRLDWAALAVVTAAVFEDYLALIDPSITKGLALLLVGAWLVRRGWRRLYEGPRSAVLVAGMAFLAAVLLAALVHNNGSAGLDVVTRYVGFLAVLGVLVDTMRGGLSPTRVARAFVLSCTGAAVCGLVAYALDVDRRVGGPIGDPNDFAFFLVAALPLSLVLRRFARRPWLYDLASGVLVVAAFGTLSRGSFVALAVMLVVALVTGAISARATLVALVGATTVVVIAIGAMPSLVGESLDQKAAVADENVTERLQLWDAASNMTLDSPVVGLGPGSYALFHDDYRDRMPDDATEQLDVAHNTYLEIAAELGLVGLAAWVVLLGTALLGVRRRFRRDHDSLSGAVLVSLVGAAVGSLFVTEQYFLPLWLLMALAAVLTNQAPSTRSVLRGLSA